MPDAVLTKLQDTGKQLAEIYKKPPSKELQSVIECVKSVIGALQKNDRSPAKER